MIRRFSSCQDFIIFQTVFAEWCFELMGWILTYQRNYLTKCNSTFLSDYNKSRKCSFAAWPCKLNKNKKQHISNLLIENLTKLSNCLVKSEIAICVKCSVFCSSVENNSYFLLANESLVRYFKDQSLKQLIAVVLFFFRCRLHFEDWQSSGQSLLL